MATIGTPIPSAQDIRRRRLRGLRPLLWWFVFVLLLFGFRTHQRLLDRTRMHFAISFQGQDLLFGPVIRFDSREIENGGKISIGTHTLRVEYPKAEPFQTNFFVWYGSNYLGNINLTRAYGVLDVNVEPKARVLTISGPEFVKSFTNSSGLTLTLPTDTYSIDAKYANSDKHDQVTIYDRQTNSWRIAPWLGALALTCNKGDSRFELLGSDNRMIEASAFPGNIVELPEGTYKVITRHHGYQFEKRAMVIAGITNPVAIELAYGRVVFKTEPTAATVTSSDDRAWGSTPLAIDELPAGNWSFTFNARGYEPATVTLDLNVDQTIDFHTNLVSRNYTAAISAAKQYFENKDYERAARSASDAFLAKQDDLVALKIQREAIGFLNLQQAKVYGKRGDYIAGVRELEKVTNALLDNSEATQLLADFKTREPGQREQIRLKRLNRAKTVFDSILLNHPDAELFDSHDLKSSKPVKDVETAISDALKKSPSFRITRQAHTAPESFLIEGEQILKTYLDTSAGKRQCLIAGAQATDEETQIVFKVLEYKAEAVEKFSIGALIGTPVDVKYVPIHPSRVGTLTEKLQTRLNEGISNVTARIRASLSD